MPGKSSGSRRRHRRRKSKKMASQPVEEGSEMEGIEMVPLRNDQVPEGPEFDDEEADDKHRLLDVAASPRARSRIAEEGERLWKLVLQVFIPFIFAGFGMVGAGLELDAVQHWPVFKNVSEVFILVPALLGLKGNLEMTLASRLSTQANLGLMDNANQKWSLIVGNLALIQCQAVVVGFLASIAASLMGWISAGKLIFSHGLLLCASSVVTAALASFILGLIMIAVILVSRFCHINPDNVATPIAASLGDLTTLALLAWIASFLYEGNCWWLAPSIIVASVLLLIPICAWLASKNTSTREVLTSGWSAVICAMIISSIGGLILDFTVSRFKGIAVFQPVINGVGGNLVAVQASRISTALHRDARLGVLPQYAPSICLNPRKIFCIKGGHARTARVLLIMVIPGHLIFSYAINSLQAGHTSLTVNFFSVYLTAALLQVLVLLYICHVMVQWMWTKRIDPDNAAIPYLTALGDLLGTGFLAIAFAILYIAGDRDSDVGD